MLNVIDTDKIIALAHDKSSAGRSALAAVIDDLFEHQANVLSDRERRLMFNIIENLVHDVEVSVRRKFSEKLAMRSDVPHSLIIALANDEADVAYPVLSHSDVLKDEDLIEIIHLRTAEYHLAITLRHDLDEDVSAALAETGNEDVIISLLNNQNAKISQATVEYLVEQSKRVDTFQEPLLHRDELHEDLAKKMFTWVSAALRDHIVGRYHLDEATVNHLLSQCAQEELTDLPGHQNEATKVLLQRLKDSGEITPDLLVKTLTRGEVPLFVGMFCDMTGLDSLLARRILFGEGDQGLALACRAIEIPEIAFATLYSKTRRISPTRSNVSRDAVNKALTQYRTIAIYDAQRALEQWRQGVDLQTPIRGIFDND